MDILKCGQPNLPACFAIWDLVKSKGFIFSIQGRSSDLK